MKNFEVVPPAAEVFLTEQQKALHEGRFERLRLTPLILRNPLDTLLNRRKRTIGIVGVLPVSYGFANLQNQRSRLANGLPGDGFQTRGISSEALAKTERQRVAAGGDRGSDFQRWNEARRLKLSRPSTTFANISFVYEMRS